MKHAGGRGAEKSTVAACADHCCSAVAQSSCGAANPHIFTKGSQEASSDRRRRETIRGSFGAPMQHRIALCRVRTGSGRGPSPLERARGVRPASASSATAETEPGETEPGTRGGPESPSLLKGGSGWTAAPRSEVGGAAAVEPDPPVAKPIVLPRSSRPAAQRRPSAGTSAPALGPRARAPCGRARETSSCLAAVASGTGRRRSPSAAGRPGRLILARAAPRSCGSRRRAPFPTGARGRSRRDERLRAKSCVEAGELAGPRPRGRSR